MTHEIPQKLTPIQWILKYWVILVFVIGSVTIWTTTRNTVDGNTADIASLKKSVAESSTINTQILVQLGQIQTDLQWVKAKLK